MDKKIGVIAIVVENPEMVERVNGLLHAYRDDIIGRMGLPMKDRGVSVISVIVEAAAERISALSGKLGMLEGVSAKTVQTK